MRKWAGFCISIIEGEKSERRTRESEEQSCLSAELVAKWSQAIKDRNNGISFCMNSIGKRDLYVPDIALL